MKAFFSASTIARATGRHYTKAVHRIAARDAWPRRLQGNRVEFVPPKNLRQACFAVAPTRRRLQDQDRTVRELLKASAVAGLVLRQRLNPGIGLTAALEATARDFRELLEFGPSSLYRWFRAAERGGLSALCERKVGRSGRPRKGERRCT